MCFPLGPKLYSRDIPRRSGNPITGPIRGAHETPPWATGIRGIKGSARRRSPRKQRSFIDAWRVDGSGQASNADGAMPLVGRDWQKPEVVPDVTYTTPQLRNQARDTAFLSIRHRCGGKATRAMKLAL